MFNDEMHAVQNAFKSFADGLYDLGNFLGRAIGALW